MIPDCYDFDEWMLSLSCPYTDKLIDEGTITTLEDLDDIENGRGFACLYVLMEHYNEGLEDALRILVHGGAMTLDLQEEDRIRYFEQRARELGGVNNFINWEDYYDFAEHGRSFQLDTEDYDDWGDEEVGERAVEDIGTDDFYFDYSAFAANAADYYPEFQFRGSTWTFNAEHSFYTDIHGGHAA